MKNFESGGKLIWEAEVYLEELRQAFQRDFWNIVVRKAQEVVELSIKGILKIMGVEYPKVHDPARFFITTLKRRGILIEEETVIKLKEISKELAEKRAPAFYFEKDYKEEDAVEAKEGAEFVFKMIKKLQKELVN